MGKRIEIPMQQLLRASKMNLEEGMTIEKIAEEFGVGSMVLRKRLEENNIKYIVNRQRKKGTKRAEKYTSNFIDKIKSKRNEYKEGQEVYIKNVGNASISNGLYYINGSAVVKKIYENFMVIENENALRESISFISIIKNEVKVV